MVITLAQLPQCTAMSTSSRQKIYVFKITPFHTILIHIGNIDVVMQTYTYVHIYYVQLVYIYIHGIHYCSKR